MVVLLLAFNDMGVWSLVYANITKVTIECIGVIYLKINVLRFGFNKTAFIELFNFGAGQSLLTLNKFFVDEGDKFVIGKFLGADSLGIYGRAYRLLVFSENLHNLLEEFISHISKIKLIKNDSLRFF